MWRRLSALSQYRYERLGGQTKDLEDTPVGDDERYSGEIEAHKAEEVTIPFADNEREMLRHLLEMPISEDSKAAELWTAIDSVSNDEPGKKILIFTEYRQTQNYLVEQLAKRYGNGCMTIIKGGIGLGQKMRNMERFRDNEQVRFMVSTEAGGEGINLQFCHVMINYDLPWNPFGLAQRYGRLYRFGQKDVVHVFNFFYKDTIDTKIRSYLEIKAKTASETLSKITGEPPAEIEQALLGTFEEFLDYEKIYREGLVKKDIKPSQSMIDEAVKKAEEAYKLGYDLLSKTVSLFNPDRFRKFIASHLDLKNVEEFAIEFVRHSGKKMTTEGKVYGFLTPTALSKEPGVQNKYTGVTFDRDLAIRERHLDFMALGHPFTDAAIRYCGRPEIGGFATTRLIRDYRFSGMEGLHFNFMVTRKRRTKDRDETFFELVPIFLTWDGDLAEGAAETALIAWGTKNISTKLLTFKPDRVDDLFRIARSMVEKKYAGEKLWEEDIFCLNAAVTKFV